MTRWLIVGAAVLVVVWACSRVIAVGRKAPRTLTQWRVASWGGGPVRFKQTQTAHRWKLALRRQKHLRKVS